MSISTDRDGWRYTIRCDVRGCRKRTSRTIPPRASLRKGALKAGFVLPMSGNAVFCKEHWAERYEASDQELQRDEAIVPRLSLQW